MQSTNQSSINIAVPDKNHCFRRKQTKTEKDDMKFLVVVLLCVSAYRIKATDDWNYEEGDPGGPDNWPNLNDSYCGGASQSPINIIAGESKNAEKYTTLEFIKYRKIYTTFTLINTGHTVQMLTNTKELQIRGAALSGEYILEQFHFHWGVNDSEGSEHFLNDKEFPIEIHLVHHNAIYNNVSQALGHDGGTAVVGIFGEITAFDDEASLAFDTLLNYIDRIPYKDNQTHIETFNVQDLLPTSQNKTYFRYDGSLTTPPCTQGVVWTVFEEPIKVTSAQMKKFRELHGGATDHTISTNHRPVQALNSRVLYTSYASVVTTTGASFTHSNTFTILVSMSFYLIVQLYREVAAGSS